ncbi:DUF3558 domain-containing protein [Saccharothrix sp. HUAS TT1]|uniref:DUF3558 domain-containing protein n=1 Tax=unclassified Saccharothrix TaxID=2593673 RepID=UPI00345C1EFA
MRRAVPLLAALALLAGCSQSTDGSANPGGTATTTTTASAGPTSTSAPADRPKAIDISGLEPCGLLTDAQRAEFGLDRPPQQDDAPGKPGCSMSREDREHSIAIYLDSTRGVEAYTEPPRPGSTALQVGGFPAVMVESTNSLGLACAIHVDVSDGQSADVQAYSLGDTDVPTLCRLVQPVAGAVVANLMNG